MKKQKILVVRYRFIGDTILTVPFLRNLRKANPFAQIDMLVGPMSGELLEDCPYIDNLIYFDTTKKHRYENTNEEKKSFFSYVKLLKKEKYDKAYVLKRSLSSALLAFFAGIPKRIGFNTENRGLFLTKKVPYVQNRHEVECFLDVLRADNVPVNDSHLENWVSNKNSAKVNEILREYNIKNDEPKVLVHATSGNVNKQWPLEYFAQVINFLANEKGVQIMYTGAPADAKVYENIHSLLGDKFIVEPVNLCGKLSLQESAALTKRADFIFGCDSGNLHLAASFNVPVIGVYGPMNPEKWHAWGVGHTCFVENMPCIPCELRKKCTNNRACLRNIKPEKVIKQLEVQLEKAKKVYIR